VVTLFVIHAEAVVISNDFDLSDPSSSRHSSTSDNYTAIFTNGRRPIAKI